MGIIQFIDKISVQPAAYWGSPANDGTGGYEYADPVEINCRWDDLTKIINNEKGEEIISNAQIITNSILEKNGMIYLGPLTDLEDSSYILDSGQNYPYPNEVEGSYKIVAIEKTPLIRSNTKFVYIYYLKPNWETKL